ncbi:helix-turn-helix transcriptional regulator [Labilibaculum sp.]|uniref:helix-turn-helix domain-containing protein n=1 Tax=Labilibaculum sp. TaxID=2060723 RepID=UPI002AA84E1C|nr:helix-turn-helix transcriptional regulator [Labilibaculum sp.]
MESSIIERVKEIRNKNKVSQIEFANSLGVSASYIAGLEMGRNSLNQKFIFAVKEKYNISADWLLFGEHSTDNTLNIDILKLVIALDNSNRFIVHSMQKFIEQTQNGTNAELKQDLLENDTLGYYNQLKNLEAEKKALYTSILEEAVMGDKSHFEITQKIQYYTDLNMKLNGLISETLVKMDSFEFIDNTSILKHLKSFK